MADEGGDDGGDGGSGHIVIEMADLPRAAPTGPVARHPSRALRRQDDEFDTDMLRRAIADTGRWAHGTISVEALVFDDSSGRLVRPPRAYWFCPVAAREGRDNEAMMRLADDSREDYVGPEPFAPGIGLPGALWSELRVQDDHPLRRLGGSEARRRGSTFGRSRWSLLGNSASGRGVSTKFLATTKPKRIAWREVKQIADDPDQPYNLRLQLLAQAGIGLAAGVTFHFRGTSGLVMYLAPGWTDVEKLKSPTNEQYLLSAADVIGSIAALRGPRRDCLEERRTEIDRAWIRVRIKMIAFVRAGGSFDAMAGGDRGKEELLKAEKKQTSQTGNRCWIYLKRNVMKWRGSNNESPPPFTTTEAVWSFMGSFLTLLVLLYFSTAVTESTPDGLNLVMGPFGALMTLQYNLTAAPASQPRNIIIGQAISLSIALGIAYTSLPPNLKMALATSLAITCMARWGVTHPPAGAAALLFAGGKYTWEHMGLMLAGNLLAILCATVINDLNNRRQYPTSWGFRYWQKHFFGGKGKGKAA